MEQFGSPFKYKNSDTNLKTITLHDHELIECQMKRVLYVT